MRDLFNHLLYGTPLLSPKTAALPITSYIMESLLI